MNELDRLPLATGVILTRADRLVESYFVIGQEGGTSLEEAQEVAITREVCVQLVESGLQMRGNLSDLAREFRHSQLVNLGLNPDDLIIARREGVIISLCDGRVVDTSKWLSQVFLE